MAISTLADTVVAAVSSVALNRSLRTMLGGLCLAGDEAGLDGTLGAAADAGPLDALVRSASQQVSAE